MSNTYAERTISRRLATQVLYESIITGDPAWEIAERDDAVPDVGALSDYAIMLIKGVGTHEMEINRLLTEASTHWSVDRMPLVDRAILSVAVFEMRYVDDVPISVAINEAIELAREFGGEDESAGFVNGVLGSIARNLESDAVSVDSETNGELE